MKNLTILLIACFAIFLSLQTAQALTFNGREYTQIEGVWYQVSYGENFIVTGSYLFVKFHSSVTETQIDSLNLANEGEIYRDREENRFTIVCTDTLEDPLDFCSYYLNSYLVESAKNLTEIKYARFPDDEHFDNQVNLRDTDQDGFDNDIDIGRAWDMVVGPDPDPENPEEYKPPVIGMIDGGLLYWHPDIINNVYQNLDEDTDNDGVLEYDPDWEWPVGERTGRWFLDEDDIDGEDGVNGEGQNGWIDDLIGINTSPHAPEYDPDNDRPYSYLLGDENEMRHCSANNNCGHGTSCASAVVSQTHGPLDTLTGERIGVAGIAGGWGDEEDEDFLPGCKIIFVQNQPVNPGMHGNDPAEDMYEVGLEYLADLAEDGTIDVVSISMVVTDGVCDYWNELIQRMIDADVQIFSAAANFDEEPVIWPGLRPGVFSVGCSYNDRRWRGTVGWGQSNFGEGLRLMVPTGQHDRYDGNPEHLQWTASVLGGGVGLEYPGYPGDFGATSGATPTVAGTALLLLCQANDLTRSELTEILCITPDKIDAEIGNPPIVIEYDIDGEYGRWDDQVGYGELNAGNTIEYGHRLEIELSDGWSLISSNLKPFYTDSIDGNGLDYADGIYLMFDELVANLIMLKDDLGRFWVTDPEYCNIPRWDYRQGYQIKLENASNWVTLGKLIEFGSDEWDIPVTENWNFVSYLPLWELTAPVAFKSLWEEGVVDVLEIAKDGYGNFYLPDSGFNNIPPMNPGSGYQIKVSEDAILIYPDEAGNLPDALGEGGDYARTEPSHFHFTSQTGDFHPILLTSLNIEGIVNESGDEIGVLTSEGLCIGAAVFEEERFIGLAAWKDDTTSVEIDGYREDDIFYLRYWDANREVEIWQDSLNIFSDLDITDEEPSFSVHDLSIGDPLVVTPTTFAVNQNYPNPFNSITEISYSLPFTADIHISVYDVAGRLVAELINERKMPGNHRAIWFGQDTNGTPVTSGLYFYRFNALSESGVQYRIIHRMVLLK